MVQRRRIGLLLLAGALITALAPASARASYAQDAIAALNAQREANGLPAGITENPEWSRGCELHMAYLTMNGLPLSHDEDPALPGYTPEGAAAGHSSVLASVGSWADGDPWEDAPIHLAQVLHPSLQQTGASPGCLTTWPGYGRAAPAETVVYTYPGSGRAGVPASEVTDELPFTPAQLLGLPNPTGPHLYVFPFGGAAQKVASAQLAGPDGPVDVRVADADTTDGIRRIGGYIPLSTAIVIPVAPLRPDATYRASVTFLSGLSHTWVFHTGPRENSLAVALADDEHGRLAVTVSSPALDVRAWSVDPAGRTGRVALTAERAGAGFTGAVGGRPGVWKVCARSGGPGTGYAVAEQCATARLKARWAVTMARTGRRLTIRAYGFTVGRRITMQAQRARSGCVGRGRTRRCGDVLTGTPFRRAVKARSSVTVRLPGWAKKRAKVWVDLRIARGRSHGIRFPALHIYERVG